VSSKAVAEAAGMCSPLLRASQIRVHNVYQSRSSMASCRVPGAESTPLFPTAGPLASLLHPWRLTPSRPPTVSLAIARRTSLCYARVRHRSVDRETVPQLGHWLTEKQPAPHILTPSSTREREPVPHLTLQTRGIPLHPNTRPGLPQEKTDSL